jgi:hypothetical protein
MTVRKQLLKVITKEFETRCPGSDYGGQISVALVETANQSTAFYVRILNVVNLLVWVLCLTLSTTRAAHGTSRQNVAEDWLPLSSSGTGGPARETAAQ